MLLREFFLRESPDRDLLIIVHPGSACGSASFNLGQVRAKRARNILAADIAAWNGDVIVADGDLSNELPRYPGLNSAILSALDRAVIGQRISADHMTNGWAQKIVATALRLGFEAQTTNVQVTGAWHSPTHGACVDHTIKQFVASGFKVEMRASVVHEDEE